MTGPHVRDRGRVKIISNPVYNWGSNFFPCAIPYEFANDNGVKVAVVFRSSEHLFMWHKNESPEFRTKILQAEHPRDAKYIGSKQGMAKFGFQLIPEWDIGDPPHKVKVMLNVVRRKFATNPGLARLLVMTGDREIVEDAPWDSFWGLGKDGNGENWLGRILMRVRYELGTGLLKLYYPNLGAIYAEYNRPYSP